MRLSIQDRNEFLKAAVRAADLDTLKHWLTDVVDAIESLPEGKADIPCPPYRPAAKPQGNGQQHLMATHPYA